MILINGTVVQTHYVEYAVEVVPGVVIECEAEGEARELGGKVLVRHVFETAYAEVAPCKTG